MINQRIDKWLWSARFFKTRVLAIAAVKSGKVRIAGHVVKPARNIAVGDVLQIRRGAFYYIITVTGLCLQRRPAKEAIRLYEETGESRLQREQLRQKLKLASAVTARPKTKPDKKARRQLRRLQRVQS
jgi:ribosome-associated heat shock protein Hsp15